MFSFTAGSIHYHEIFISDINRVVLFCIDWSSQGSRDRDEYIQLYGDDDEGAYTIMYNIMLQRI